MPTELAALERLRLRFDGVVAVRKLSCLKRLARAPMPSAKAVLRLHEVLCFMHAYPDDAAIELKVRRMLQDFARRGDVRRHREALTNSGIAGTPIVYRFFYGQAQWLADRWPDRFTLERSDGPAGERIARALPALLTPGEAQALIEAKPEGWAALDAVRPRHASDAAFLQGRIAGLPGSSYVKEVWSDGIDATYRLEPGPDTPSRTRAWLAAAPRGPCGEGPSRARPDLRAQMKRAPRRIRPLTPAHGREVIDLARAAMVVRERSLEAFSFANPDDAWLVDDGDGLAFAIVGVVPERRHALASFYGGLTLRRGVPIGYVQSDIIGTTAALSFNTFETFRGGEAAWSFGRWLAALHHLFGTSSFSIEPYQLGLHNEEALHSGAYGFYAKLGFAPRDAATLALLRAEQARMARRPVHRSSLSTLRTLASKHLHFDLDPLLQHPLVPAAALGLAAGTALSAVHGADRERAVCEAVDRLRRACGVKLVGGSTAGEIEGWRRMAPWLMLLGADSWRAAERRALVDVIVAKGARSERQYVDAYRAHPCLADAVNRWRPADAGSRGR